MEQAVRDRGPFTDNDLFRMGAAVAVGELFDMGRLGDKASNASQVRSYLASFVIRGIDDIQALGITGPYAGDFLRLYEFYG